MRKTPRVARGEEAGEAWGNPAAALSRAVAGDLDGGSDAGRVPALLAAAVRGSHRGPDSFEPTAGPEGLNRRAETGDPDGPAHVPVDAEPQGGVPVDAEPWGRRPGPHRPPNGSTPSAMTSPRSSSTRWRGRLPVRGGAKRV